MAIRSYEPRLPVVELHSQWMVEGLLRCRDISSWPLWILQTHTQTHKGECHMHTSKHLQMPHAYIKKARDPLGLTIGLSLTLMGYICPFNFYCHPGLFVRIVHLKRVTVIYFHNTQVDRVSLGLLHHMLVLNSLHAILAIFYICVSIQNEHIACYS